jgi:hypothetical protein
MTLIELLQNRRAIQKESGNEMKARFEAHSLELQEVLIGTPRAAAGDLTIENILLQLRSQAIGTANAQATKLSVDAHGGPEYRLAEQNFSRFADALTRINQPLVPQFLMSGAGPGEQWRPDPDRDARTHDARRPGEIEGRGAEDPAPRQWPVARHYIIA